MRSVTGRTTNWCAERGSTTLEMAVLAPGLLLIIALLAFAGRHAVADGVIDQAAADAARAASLQRTASAGRTAASTVAHRSLDGQGLSCVSIDVDVDTSGLTVGPGRPGRVTVAITCSLRVADLPLPIPATTIRSTAVSPVDTYRER